MDDWEELCLIEQIHLKLCARAASLAATCGGRGRGRGDGRGRDVDGGRGSRGCGEADYP